MAVPKMIASLTPPSEDKVLLLRATRVWETIDADTGILQHTNIVFVDGEGSHILAVIHGDQKQTYCPSIKEGDVYTISHFKLVPAPTDYPTVVKEFALNLHHGSNIVVQSEGSASIPRYKFQLKDLGGPPITRLQQGKPHRMTTIAVALWGAKADQFLNALRVVNDSAAFVVIAGLQPESNYDTFLLSSTNATKTYCDIDYAPLNVLKAEISAVSGCAIGNLPPPAGPRFMNGAPVTLAKDIFPTNVVAEAPAGDEVHLPSPLFYHGQLYVPAPTVALQHGMQNLSIHEAGPPAP
ncbi:hypothetical protein ACET3Z_027629 [Daucus carota]